jgi:hypothetical protein
VAVGGVSTITEVRPVRELVLAFACSLVSSSDGVGDLIAIEYQGEEREEERDSGGGGFEAENLKIFLERAMKGATNQSPCNVQLSTGPILGPVSQN